MTISGDIFIDWEVDVTYEEMFEEVERRLELLHEKFENERDSAINASKRRGPLPKDSLRRVEEIEY